MMNHDIRMTAQKIARRLALIEPLAYRRQFPLAPFRFRALSGPDVPPPLEPNIDDADWQELSPHTYWGKQNLNFVLRGAFTVPPDFDAGSPAALFLPLGEGGDFSHPEALVYIDGESYAAVDRHHQECLVNSRYCDGQPHNLMLHGWTGLLGGTPIEPGKQLFLRECAVVQIDAPTREFITAARTALEAANLLDEIAPEKTRLYNALDDAFTLLDTREPFGEAFYASVPAALRALREGIACAGESLDVEVIAAGHAHIDMAWLWTVQQTRQKARRTFHTVLRYMEQFPEYHFSQSQPQLYDDVRQDDPQLFKAISQRIDEGRWEALGGMWVEADCNISGPESLARQFLSGRTFFRKYFGRDAESPVLWLPDVFGYAWNLPQLIKQAGMEYFFTIKIGWNRTNKMPYDSFWWQGLDGTKVLTHFSTTPEVGVNGEDSVLHSVTYNANLSAFGAYGSWVNLKHKENQRVMLMSYGYGDGGGGPTREMNENAQELKHFPGLPRVTQGKVIDFFRRLEAESGGTLPVWNGELYLEIHRGTYTTQSRSKRANRQSEFLIHDAEFAATLAALIDSDYVYPQETLRKAWKLVCLNQFHDIIPGSSINAVYIESLQQYAGIRKMGEAVREEALGVIAKQVGGDVILVNPTGFTRNDLAFWKGSLPQGTYVDGNIPTQAVENGTLIGIAQLAPYSVTSLSFKQGEAGQNIVNVGARASCPHKGDGQDGRAPKSTALIENACLRVELNEAGDISRIYDKIAQREVLPEGAVANQFQAFEDRPLDWDAWDIDIFYEDTLFLAEPAESITVVEDGPLRATLEITRQILNSRYTQRISVTYKSPQLDFDTTIDWRERHILLKTAFPADILSPVATYEIQWGNIQRPTHRNTSWDWARFETCAQKWVDLSEGGYGVALLNDCKYGHDIRDNVIRLSLLRGPTMPDPQADQGEHRFAYSLYPHANEPGCGCNPAQIAQRAYALNDPILTVDGQLPVKQSLSSLVTLSPNTVIETIKQAEDGNGVIVRFYECNRQRGEVTLRTGFPLQAASLTNLLEDDQKELEVNDTRVNLNVKPFQIVTLRLIPDRQNGFNSED